MNLSRCVVLGIVAALIFVFGPVNVSVSSPRKSGTERMVVARVDHDAPQTACRDIPVFKDEVIGFSVHKPSGWQIRYMTGGISIVKDAQAREGVIIYPVRPKAGLSINEFLSSYLNNLKKASSASSRVDYAEVLTNREGVRADLTGSIGGIAVRGVAAAHAVGPDYVCRLYWAPADVFSSEQAFLKCLADSYQPTAGQPLVTLRGSYFETMAPKGWKIVEESSNAVNFRNAADDAGVMSSYLDFGNDAQPMTIPRLFAMVTRPCPPGQQPCFSITKSYTRLAAVDASDFKDTLGRPWKARAEEFEATLKDTSGTKVHGVLTGMVMCGRHITGLYGWIIATSTRISRPDAWERNSLATAIVQENLKITKASDLITRRILPRNNPYDSSNIMAHGALEDRVRDKLRREWGEAIGGYEAFKTSHGERVDVPLNSIPGGNNPLHYNSQTGTFWNATLQPPPRGFQPLERVSSAK